MVILTPGMPHGAPVGQAPPPEEGPVPCTWAAALTQASVPQPWGMLTPGPYPLDRNLASLSPLLGGKHLEGKVCTLPLGV